MCERCSQCLLSPLVIIFNEVATVWRQLCITYFQACVESKQWPAASLCMHFARLYEPIKATPTRVSISPHYTFFIPTSHVRCRKSCDEVSCSFGTISKTKPKPKSLQKMKENLFATLV